MGQSDILAQANLLFSQIDPSMLPYTNIIAERAILSAFQPHDLLPRPAENQRQVAYVMEGVFRIFFTDTGNVQTTVQLLSEGESIVGTDGYQYMANQVYQCEALTKGILAIWSHEALEYFANHLPNWNHFAIKATQQIMMKIVADRDEMFKDDATTRYQKFVERHPTIVERIQLRYVADHLGIAPQSLSRIRQQLGKC